MSKVLKQTLVLGALVAGAFGVATLLNGRRRKRKTRRSPELEDLEPLDLVEAPPEPEP
jgi:hypothetical protein